jgi:hypothetical protein
MVPLSKSGVRKHRGFESRPLRHPISASRGRGRLVDYGAALEMRFGATRRGFESRPLRHLDPHSDGPCRRWRLRALGHPSPDALAPVLGRRPGLDHPAGGLRPNVASPAPPHLQETGTAVSLASRARRGTSGALYLQSAPAGLNSLPRSALSYAARRCDVEDRVPRSGEPRTVPGPEGSSTKRPSSGAADRPGPSRSSWWAWESPGRRRVHGTANPLAHVRRRS